MTNNVDTNLLRVRQRRLDLQRSKPEPLDLSLVSDEALDRMVRIAERCEAERRPYNADETATISEIVERTRKEHEHGTGLART